MSAHESTPTAYADIDVPREFLPALVNAATEDIGSAANVADLTLLEGDRHVERRAEEDEVIEPLSVAIAARSALLRAYDDHRSVPLAVLRTCAADAIDSVRFDLALAADSSSTSAEELVKLADLLRAMSAWADEHGLIEREAVA